MFEEDNEGYGLYGFNQAALDPQATNAINTQLVSMVLPLAATPKKMTPYAKQINELSGKVNLSILIESSNTITILSKFITHSLVVGAASGLVSCSSAQKAGTPRNKTQANFDVH